jgi:hypothetical protein
MTRRMNGMSDGADGTLMRQRLVHRHIHDSVDTGVHHAAAVWPLIFES